ncbi:MAG: hypothetical protein ACQETL_04155 [Bacteroidota bacterium]
MRHLFLIISVFILFSCQDDSIDFNPTEKFNSIFDNPSEGLNFKPLDIIETEDGGFIVLSELANQNIFILRVSNRGEFLWSDQLLPQFNDPVPNLVEQDGNYYFVASTVPDFTATLFQIDDLDQNIEALRTYTGYRKPLAFNYLTNESFLMLTYNDTTGSVLSKLQDGFAMEWARRYDDIQNAHQNLESFEANNRNDFFVGAHNAGSLIYFNSLRREGVTLTYTDSEGIESGKIKSNQRNFINSFVPYGDGSAAVNYIFNGETFFIPSYTTRINDSTNLQVIDGELMQDRLSIRKATSGIINIGGVEYVVNGYTTLDGRIKLNFYETGTGSQVAIKYLGGVDPLQIVKIIPTEDEGIAILSRITIAGAKQRINVVKIPKSELEDILLNS